MPRDGSACPPGAGPSGWRPAREAFEEAGVLLARYADGQPVRFDADPTVEARFDAHRRAVHAGARSLLAVLAAEALVLSVDEMRYVAHWITPEGAPKRFDTRFFLARAPDGQAYVHDDAELIGSEWVRPADALDRHRAGDFPLIEPTVRSLEDLGPPPDGRRAAGRPRPGSGHRAGPGVSAEPDPDDAVEERPAHRARRGQRAAARWCAGSWPTTRDR